MKEAPAATEILQDGLRADAEAALAWEHALTPQRAFKVYAKGVWFAAVMSITFVMEGFDTKIIGSIYSQPDLVKDVGFKTSSGSYQISAAWQSGLAGLHGACCLIGMFLAGYLTERFGFRKTMASALVSTPPIIFVFFFATSLPVIAVAHFLMSIPLGIFMTATTVYVAELLPLSLRPYLTSCATLCWALGQLLNAGVFRACLGLPRPWSYRIPFAIQWFWPVLLLVVLYFAPESPWWLVRQNRLDEAKAVVSRLTSEDRDVDVKQLVALMQFTTNHERQVEARTSYLACFKGSSLRRTVICMGAYVMQLITGSSLRSYMTYFFLQAGLPVDQSFNMTIVALALSVLGVFGAWAVMSYAGRRRMYLVGTSFSIILFFAIGGLGVRIRDSPSPALSWAVGSLLAVDDFVAHVLLLPLTYVLVSEIPSSVLRSKTVVIARNIYTICNVVAGVVTPYMLNPTAWNWGAETGFFWGGCCVLGLFFTFFLVPESKGRTTAEIDILFEAKTPTRKFRETVVGLSKIESCGGQFQV